MFDHWRRLLESYLGGALRRAAPYLSSLRVPIGMALFDAAVAPI
jgi:hypothetical protein